MSRRGDVEGEVSGGPAANCSQKAEAAGLATPWRHRMSRGRCGSNSKVED